MLLFLNVMNLGFTGLCIATNLVFVSRFLVVYFLIEKTQSLKNIYDVVLFSKETTVNLVYQFNLGLSGMIMAVWGWWAFDIFTLIASYLSVDIISA